MKHSILTKQDNCSLSLIICFTETGKEQEILPVAAGSAGGAGIVLIAVVVFCVCYRRKRTAKPDNVEE
jgi:hypothetical protein